MLTIDEVIHSDVTGRFYTITWASDKITQAEVGFARTSADGESFFIKRLLNAKYKVSKDGKPLTPATVERNKKMDERFKVYSELYNDISNGCGELGACVPIIDYFREGPFYYTVYRKINATSLSLTEISHLPDAEKYRILLRLVQGLQPMHTLGVIHGDLKPDNILVQRDGGQWRIRLIDMNDCYRAGEPNEPGAVIGTLDYYSPELTAYNTYDIEDWEDEEEMAHVKSMAKNLTTKSDVFALGIIFHEFFTGERPKITEDSVNYICDAAKSGCLSISSSIPERLRVLISDMLNPDFTKRPSLAEVGNRVRANIVGTSVADPTFSIVFLKEDLYKVTINSDNPDASVFYTTDGTTPTNHSSRYEEPLELKKYTTLKAICINGRRRSNVAQRQVVVIGGPLVVSKPPKIVVHGRDIIITLDSRSPETSSIYYTLDGSNPTNKSALYSSPISVDNNVSEIRAIVIETGARVRPSSVVSAKVYKTKVHAPKISKTYLENKFEITTPDSSMIFYTLDGSIPTAESIKYTEPFSVKDISDYCIKAICIDSEGDSSDIYELKSSCSRAKMKFVTK